MIEIVIDERDWQEKQERLRVIIEKMLDVGWEKFGTNGFIVLFKDTSLSEARNELKKLNVNELEPQEWKENLYEEYLN